VEDFTFTSDQSIKNLSLDTLTTIGSLGEGASGKVEKVRHEPTGEIYAMKVYLTIYLLENTYFHR
jgi:hypothetical protein